MRFTAGSRAPAAAAEEACAPVGHADLRGLRCPLPVLRTARRLMVLAPGERLEILCDDPLAAIDLPNFCRQEGQRLVGASHEADHTRFVIERGERSPDLDKG